MICVSERCRAILPSVQRGFSSEFVNQMEKSGAGEYICELAYRRGGFVTFRGLPEMPEPLPAFPGVRFEQFRQVLESAGILRRQSRTHCDKEKNQAGDDQHFHCKPIRNGR